MSLRIAASCRNGDSRAQTLRLLGEEAIRDLFSLAWRCGLAEEAEAAVAVIADHPEAVEAERTIPAALPKLCAVQ